MVETVYDKLITFNVYKQEPTVKDMTSFFNGRVGDQGVRLAVRWVQGVPGTLQKIDVIERKMYGSVHLMVGNGVPDGQGDINMDVDAKGIDIDSDPANNLPEGITVFKLPQEAFPQKGFAKGYFALKDELGNVWSSIDVWFKVKGGVPYLAAKTKYFSDEWNTFIAMAKKQNDDFANEMRANYQQKTTDVQNSLTKATANLNDLAETACSINSQIKANNIVTKQQFDNGIASDHDYIDQKFKEMIENIGDATPHFIDKASDLSTTYPTGTNGLWVAKDDGNRYVWFNGQWTNSGAYQGQGIKDKYITNRMIADNTIQDNVINTVHLSSIQDSYAYIGEAIVWNGLEDDQTIITGKNHNVVWIKNSTKKRDAGVLFPVRLPFVPTEDRAVYVDFYYQTVNAEGLEDKVDIWITQNDGTIIKYLWGGKKKEGYGKIKLSASDFATNNYPQNFSVLISVHGGAGTLDVSMRVSYNPDNIELPIRDYQLGNLISTNHPRTGLWDPEAWIDASKVRSSNKDLLSKAIIWNGKQYDALNYNNAELVKTSGDLSYDSGVAVLVDADTSTDQYIKVVYGYHSSANPANTVGVFLGDASFNIKASLGGTSEVDAAGVVTAHIEPWAFRNYGINNNQFTIIIGGKASAIYVKEIQVSTLPIEKTLPNALTHVHNYVGEPDEQFYGQNVNDFSTATKATIDGLTLGTSGTGYSGDDGRLKSIQAYVPEQKSYTFTVGKIDQNNLLVSGQTFEVPLGKGFNGVDMIDWNIKIGNGEMLFMDLSEAGVYTPDGSHPKYLNTKLRDGSHPSTKAGYTGQMFYDANYLVPFSYSVATKNLPQQISTLKDELAEAKDQLAKEKAKKVDVITSANGKSYRLVVADNGSLSAVSTLPNDVVIFGNSLTLADGYIGMAASDPNHDYYHYVTEYIKSKNPNVRINDRTGMGTWESATTTADREKVFNETTKPLLSADTDLVIIQLGDNVNTPEKKATLEHDAGEFIQEIHSVSPKAKIYWIYGWFGDYDTVFTPIQNACDANGATGIDVNDLNTAENQNKLGTTRHGINGETWQITRPGEAIHPGDKGMKAIADRVISNFDF